MTACPKVDARDAAAIEAQLRALFPYYVPAIGKQTADGATDALISIFARYCEIAIDRLNRAPEKNLLAFLNLLGAEPLPVQAARVPLTFHLTDNARGAVTVPALSQVAAPPTGAQKEPILFETEQEFTAIPAQLDALMVKDPPADRYADYCMVLEPVVNAKREKATEAVRESGVPLFSGDSLIEHSMYLSLGAIATTPLQQLTIHIEVGKPAAHALSVAWSVSAGGKEQVLSPASDATSGFTKSGDVVFSGVPAITESLVGGVTNRWLKCRLLESLTGAMPQIARLTVTPEVQRAGIALEKAFANTAPVDISKDFYPLGMGPKFGDTLYLASRAAFSTPGAAVKLHIQLTNPASSGAASPLPPVQPQATQLAWEFWDGSKWADLGVSDFGRTTPWPSASFSDTTNTFSESGDVTFQFSAPPRPTVLNGQESYWVRVRLIFGDYGREATLERDPAKGVIPVNATFRPPMVHAIECEYRVASTFEPEAILCFNDFSWSRLALPAEPFQAALGDHAFAYFGLSTTLGHFPGRSMNLFCAIAKTTGIAATGPMAETSPLVWEYWNGLKWAATTVRDDSAGFRHSGVIRFLTPSDFAPKSEFGLTRYWWRVHRPMSRESIPGESRPGQSTPRLRRALLNTVMAVNSQTTFGEVVGSSNSTAGQNFHTARKPVLQGQRLEVLEPRMPPTAELKRLLEEEGASGINKPELAATALTPTAVWVRWHEVAAFTESDSQDRHYILDHETGSISFGDGVHGKAPSSGTNNIRLYRYQTGGGSAGNVPAGAIAQLKTTLPYVEGAVNFEPAAGGADPEPVASMIERAPRITRHNFRAVNEQDFEDLAMLASPAVVKAMCIAGFDLATDPNCTRPKAGVVSVVIVPRSSDSAPAPDGELLDRVRAYLDDRRLTPIQLILVGPEYVRIDVTVEVTVDDPGAAGDVELAVREAVMKFLHPLSGGIHGRGWSFGRIPSQSDFYGLIESVAQVNHVRLMRIEPYDDAPGASSRKRFLIHGGTVKVTSTLQS